MSEYENMLGAVASPPDKRDFQISSILTPEQQAVTLPSRFSAQPVPPILNQGKTPMCVGYSSTGMRMQQQRKDLGAWLPLDPVWLYYECKKIDGYDGDGSYVRAAMSVLKNKGQAVKQGAGLPAKNRITTYYAVGRTPNEIKRAVYTYGTVVLAMPWWESWFRPGSRGVLPRPDRQAGGHAIQCAGWDDNRGLLLSNSWGREWPGSINGNAFLPYAYVTPDTIWEAWRSVDTQG